MSSAVTNDADPEQLARLLSLGIERQTTAELLEERLGGPLPSRPPEVDPPAPGADRVCDSPTSSAERTLGEVLMDRNADITVIEAIKAHTKRSTRRREPASEHAVAVTVNYAAIASALICHGKKLSTHSNSSLERAFTLLIDKEWMSPSLGDLLVEARKVCRGRAGEATP